MGKSLVNDHDENCPICYSEIEQISQPKRCNHRFCYECLSNWVKKGKKNCPLCRKGFSSVFKFHKKQITKANGQVVEKQKREQIKNEQIRAQKPLRTPFNTQSHHYLRLGPLIIPGSITFLIPSFPVLTHIVIPESQPYFSVGEHAMPALSF